MKKSAKKCYNKSIKKSKGRKNVRYKQNLLRRLFRNNEKNK